ncbi:hypothetical protein HPB50_016245 [Hyalomma asiaticum]|uniref:Uncharacterized protein n=1 Tax=Hyalomma asiaticum TaxID=266040 RepID=A0ACB7SZ43_HYAAI|nr:hypothetical protein HPB50_016245 [Hyalomma asiaticum]
MQHSRDRLPYESDDYGAETSFIESPIDIMNLLETFVALILFGGVLKQDLMSIFHHFLCCSAATYFFNDFCFFFTSLLSKQSAACMPSIFYVSSLKSAFVTQL